jgi:ketosteroid isomerase-like protein
MKSDRFRAAAEGKDFSAIDELFTEDVVFFSPVVFKPYKGREAVAMLLGAVVQVFEDFRYVDQLETGESTSSTSQPPGRSTAWRSTSGR